MQKKIVSTLVAALVVLSVGLATGCGRGVPKSSSPEVQELVQQIVRDLLRDSVSAACYEQISGIPIDVVGIQVDYAWLTERAKTEEEAKSALEAVNSAMDQIQILLENIRTDRVEKEIGKIHCRADVRVGDATDGIVFTAQYNDDGDLYVEVSGFGDE